MKPDPEYLKWLRDKQYNDRFYRKQTAKDLGQWWYPCSLCGDEFGAFESSYMHVFKLGNRPGTGTTPYCPVCWYEFFDTIQEMSKAVGQISEILCFDYGPGSFGHNLSAVRSEPGRLWLEARVLSDGSPATAKR